MLSSFLLSPPPPSFCSPYTHTHTHTHTPLNEQHLFLTVLEAECLGKIKVPTKLMSGTAYFLVYSHLVSSHGREQRRMKQRKMMSVYFPTNFCCTETTSNYCQKNFKVYSSANYDNIHNVVPALHHSSPSFSNFSPIKHCLYIPLSQAPGPSFFYLYEFDHSTYLI
jgi:hypothetical protein